MKRFTLSSGGSLTILLITQDQLVRADFASRGGTLKRLSRCPRPMGEELPALVDAALRLDRRKPNRVFILASEVWTQVLGLHSSATNGINDAELARALTFEAEALSGLSAFDSEAALVTLGSEGSQRLFWIVQLPRWQRDQLDETVRQAGGTLAGVAHPAALPMPLRQQTPGRWQRLELWSHSVVAVEGSGEAITRLHVVNADPRSQGWHDEIETWFGAATAITREHVIEDTVLAESAAPRGRGAAGQPLILDDDASLGEFLGRWARQLAKAKPAVPLIRPAPKPLTKQQRSTISAVLALVAAGGFTGDYFVMKREIASSTAKSTAIKARIAQLDGIKKQATELEKQRDKEKKSLEAVRADVEQTETDLANHRTRWGQLLKLLAERCPEHLVVEKIDDANGNVSLTGESLGPGAANELATSLGAELRAMGWYVQPAKKESGKTQFSGEPWKFTLELHELPAGAVTVARPTTPAPGRPPVRTGPADRVVRTSDMRVTEE